MKTTKYLIMYMLLACVALYGCQEIEEPINNIPTVTTHEVEKVGTTTAYLTGEISEKNFVRGKFLLSTTEEFTDYIEVDANAKGMQFYADIEGLATGTTYYCILSVTDGRSEVKGKVVKFTTQNNSVAEIVDLGLSVKWASFNVGASKPEDYGDYFAWGEIEEKKTYSWETYTWCNGTSQSFTKYCTNSQYGTVDDIQNLLLEDDVAQVKWGENWRIPTESECQELREKCTWTWGEQNGIMGYHVKASNGNSIFLPAAGGSWVDSNGYTVDNKRGLYGFYWSSTLGDDYNHNACSFYFYENSGYSGSTANRSNGRSIRPVYDDKDESSELQVTEGDYVDLGLPSGTLWASCNVGANNPEEVGGYYAWGEIEEKKYYGDNYNGGTNSYNSNILDLKDDVAHAILGEDWRMPTVTEAQELIKECNWVRGTYKDIVGCYVISKTNGNCIFLPSGGHKAGKTDKTDFISDEGYGHYWTSSEYEHVSNEWAYALNAPDFSGEHLNPYAVDDKYRWWGLPVRPIYAPQPTTEPIAEAIDLGLSVKWASFNVGATKPEEYGGYYAWGETEEKEDYSWET